MTENNPNRFLNIVAAIFLIGFIVFVLKELQFHPSAFIYCDNYLFYISSVLQLYAGKKFPSAVAIIIVVISIIFIISNIASVYYFHKYKFIFS